MRKSEALRIRANIETGAQSLDDRSALETVSLYPAWGVDVEYAVDFRVRYNDILYRCLTAHKSQETWTPDVPGSLWTKVLIPDENVIPEWEQPDSTNPYKVGDIVTHNGKTWKSIVDTNTWEPGVYGWEEVTE